jgi:hypothetical protein
MRIRLSMRVSWLLLSLIIGVAEQNKVGTVLPYAVDLNFGVVLGTTILAGNLSFWAAYATA